MAGDGREFEAWDGVTRMAEGLPEEHLGALMEESVTWPGRRPMPYRWWEQWRRGDGRPWHAAADHRVLYISHHPSYDAEEYEAFDGGPPADPDEGPDLGAVEAVAVSPDLRWLALTLCSDGNTACGGLYLLDMESGTWHQRALDDDDALIGWGRDVAFAPDGSLLAVATSTDLQMLVWRTHDMTCLWSAGPEAVTAGTADAWGFRGLSESADDDDESALFFHTGFSGDGRLVVAADDGRPYYPSAREGRIVVAVADSGEVVFATTVPARGEAVLDHSGRRLAHIAADGEVVIYDVSSGEVVARHRTGLPGARALACSPDGDAIAVGGDGAIEVLRPGHGRPERVRIDGTCRSVVWSSDGPRALVIGDRHATVTDGAGRELWTRRIEHPNSLVAAFAADARVLVTIDDTDEVVAWFLYDGRPPPSPITAKN